MRILLLAATGAEIAPFLKYTEYDEKEVLQPSFEYYGNIISICIAGVGMVNTAYNLTKILSKHNFDCVVQAGIAGSFSENLMIGEVVVVETDLFGDFGTEDKEQFLDIFEMGLMIKENFPFKNGRLPVLETEILKGISNKKVKALTVNKVTGNNSSISMLGKKYACDIESMEGAACHYVCLSEQVPFIQVRSISNYIEPRDKSKWNITLAVEKLNEWLFNYLIFQ